jgi:hypothetical protein
MKNALKMLAGAAMMSMVLVGTGCESNQKRHAHNKVECCGGGCGGEGKDCCGQCGGDKAVACSHMNAKIDCPGCKPGEPCCSGCEAKMAKACPDCKGKDS